MARDWTADYMRNGFVKEVKEKRLKQGENPEEKPTHQWLRDNGFRQFLRRARELGYTPDEYLLEVCGFEQPSQDWPCNNTETIQKVEEWIKYQDEVGDRINGGTIGGSKSHLSKCMEVSQEYAATSDLLKFGRGEKTVCSNRAQQLMKGLKEEYPDGGTRSNYVRTLRDFLDYQKNMGVVEHNPFTYLVDDSGWGHELARPDDVMSVEVVAKYFDACETRAEQMLILSLGGYGLRPDDLGVDGEDAYRLNAPIPHVNFSKDRKNGVSRVALAVGIEFTREYFEVLNRDPDYEGALFPSDDSESGCRTTEWVRTKIAEIGSRVDVTLENGEKPKPSSFRDFWYSFFIDAFGEWLDNADNVAKIQGSKSGESARPYFDKDSWLSHFLDFVRPKLQAAFPEEIEPAEELGNIDVDVTLSEETSEGKNTTSQVSLDRYGGSKEAPAAIEPVSMIVQARLKLEHNAAAASETLENYPLSPRQISVTSVGLVVWAVLIGTVWGLSGTFYIDPVTKHVVTSPGTIIGLCLGLVMVLRDLPDLSGPPNAS